MLIMIPAIVIISSNPGTPVSEFCVFTRTYVDPVFVKPSLSVTVNLTV